jgi:sigma-E factor negative regulatory protein RseC
MNETQATVVATEGGYARVRPETGGCGRCHEQGGCGGQNLAQMFCSTPREFRVLNPRGAVVGERVTVVVGSGALQRGATRGYVVPLLGLMVGAVAGDTLGGEPTAIAGALAGLALGWYLGPWRRNRQLAIDDGEPHIR